MKIAAVLFDVFGTLLEISRPAHPYRQLIQEGRRQGRKYGADDVRAIMTNRLSLAGAAAVFGIKLSSGELCRLEALLKQEIDSIRPFPDAIEAVHVLLAAGLPVAACSNLAEPYGAVVKQFFPRLDGYGFSFQLGVMKPAPAMYLQTCNLLGVEPGNDFNGQGRVMMIGDSIRCDRDGPRQIGIGGVLLRRGQLEGFSSLSAFARAVLEYE
ncbi:HAD family hydrolase [Pseudomonas simiae]